MMKLDLSRVRYSWTDKKRNLRVPQKLTPELAEDIGTHLGDGSLYCDKPGQQSFRFSYSGNIKEFQHMHHIIELKRKLYGLTKIHTMIRGNEIRITFSSLGLRTFYQHALDIPIGAKTYIGVPQYILNSKDPEIKAGFLRGIIDTDFGLVIRNKYGKKYPALHGSFASRDLVLGLQKLFDSLGIKNFVSLDKTTYNRNWDKSFIQSSITISGYRRVAQWLKLIGYRNKKYDKRVKILKWARPDFLETADTISL